MAALFLRPRNRATGGWIEIGPADGHCPHTSLGVAVVCANGACGRFDVAVGAEPAPRGAAERAWKRVALARGSIVIEYRSEESWAHVGVAGTWASEAMTLPKAAAVPREVLCLLRMVASGAGRQKTKVALL
jgi:hypothetical protein